jgi:Kef-type K+ transport system membrane component KefB
MSTTQIAYLLCALTIVLLATHALASLFLKIRQPAVIGELLAGLLLGPTVFGLISADGQAHLFPATGPGAGALQTLSQLGLLLLMFVTGSEMQLFDRRRTRDGRTVALVAITGLTLPLVFGIVLAQFLDSDGLSGPTGTPTTFGLVFGIAVAVTSIPVISRIMLDLDMLDTALARVVLAVAALEDIVLYAILAVVLSLAHTPSSAGFGLWALIDSDSTGLSIAYHVSASLLFFVVALLLGPAIVRRLLHSPANIIGERSPTALRITLLLGSVIICVLLGINAVFGALLAGVALRRAEARTGTPAIDGADGADGAEGVAGAVGTEGAEPDGEDSTRIIRQFAVAFFIPVYFASVGLSLDLVRDFDVVFFLWFIVLCSVVKIVSVWVGARIAGQTAWRSLDLAMALNGRGGPGIVLATVTLAEGIINERFFTSLVLLSVFTSQFAGIWLDRRLPALRAHEAAESREAESAEPEEPAEVRPPTSRR